MPTTADAWTERAIFLFKKAGDKSLSSDVRSLAEEQSEEAWAMADLLRGKTSEMWNEECRQYQAEDDAMVARRTPEQKAQAAQEEKEAEWAARNNVYDEYGYLVEDAISDEVEEYDDDEPNFALSVMSRSRQLHSEIEMA